MKNHLKEKKLVNKKKKRVFFYETYDEAKMSLSPQSKIYLHLK